MLLDDITYDAEYVEEIFDNLQIWGTAPLVEQVNNLKDKLYQFYEVAEMNDEAQIRYDSLEHLLTVTQQFLFDLNQTIGDVRRAIKCERISKDLAEKKDPP